jgi:hypothetical protein
MRMNGLTLSLALVIAAAAETFVASLGVSAAAFQKSAKVSSFEFRTMQRSCPTSE